jgi:hypothetical protein
MILITPQIVGPGIDEEYADAMDRIARIETALTGFPSSNDTPEGRMVYQMMWLRQEIAAKRLPIPLDRRYWSTLGYLVGEGSLDYLGIEKPLGELARILRGVGMLKKRHYPVVVAMIDDFLALANQAPRLDPVELSLLDEARAMRAKISSGSRLPLDEAQYPTWKAVPDAKNLEALPDYLRQSRELSDSLFYEYRPPPARKPPLPAPNPGMVWGGS